MTDVKINSIIFILGFKLVFYVLKVLSWSLIF